NHTDTGADESGRTGASAGGVERYDGTGWIAAGSAAAADRALRSSGHECRLFEAEEPSLESDCAVYRDECSCAAFGKYRPAEVADAGRQDLSESGACCGTGA